ncbi:hypothetical protein S7711_11442 [Stachybotrys chartarum IBT 7711]|uniref:Uncharacterized protein n=1 Tax=Stachybotrys chartarum (strain CBS 109288 / IBT 7711) TaxID=1280523 RepID=A0A084AXD5_STACB|nr:hypothetical protein S7711_11442 [Stachybotrys chartarum IBT 7711]KFA46378.1 hypothetical protein S40293_11464 [Stachybotrys chartarum IBT 40293]
MYLHALFLRLLAFTLATAPHSHAVLVPAINSIPSLEITAHRNNKLRLLERQIETELSACGFLDGNTDQSRTAEPDYNCRVDPRNG